MSNQVFKYEFESSQALTKEQIALVNEAIQKAIEAFPVYSGAFEEIPEWTSELVEVK